jgi:hypothetical protein
MEAVGVGWEVEGYGRSGKSMLLLYFFPAQYYLEFVIQNGHIFQLAQQTTICDLIRSNKKQWR